MSQVTSRKPQYCINKATTERVTRASPALSHKPQFCINKSTNERMRAVTRHKSRVTNHKT